MAATVSGVVKQKLDLSETNNDVKSSQTVDHSDEDGSSQRDSDEDGQEYAGSSQAIYWKVFTYKSEIEKLPASKKSKRKLLKLCEKIEESFTISPSQYEKVQEFSARVDGLTIPNLGVGIWSPNTKREELGNDMFNTGAFTTEEIETIEENYLRFCRKFHFDPEEDVNIFLPSTFTHRNGVDALNFKDLHAFCHYLSKNIPYRTKRSIYTKFVKLHSAYKTGKFTSIEDELLLSWYELNPAKYVFAIVGRILHRSRFLVRRRLLRIVDGHKEYENEKRRIHSYNPPYVEDILELDNDVYPDWTKNEEAWKKMADMKNQFNVKELKKSYFQQVYPSVRASKRVRSMQFKRELIEILSSLEDPTWDSVDWVKLGKDCYNVGAVRVYSVIRKLTKKYVHKKYWNNLADALLKIRENCVKLAVKKRKKKEPNDSDFCEDDSPKSKPRRGRSKSWSSGRKKGAKTRKSDVLPGSEDEKVKEDEKCSAEELDEVMITLRRKKKQQKLGTCEETIESPCSETNLGENSETKEIEDEKSSAVEINGVTISPRRKKKRAKLETVDETDKEEIESPCSETNLGENTQAKEVKGDKSNAVELSETMSSPQHKKKRAKLETVGEAEEIGTESPCSETNLGENSETKEIEDEKSSAVEINGVTISPRRKKKRAKLETVDETDKEEIESPCSETNLGENTQAKEVKGDKSNSVELSETMSSPQHKKKRAKLETVGEAEEIGTESPCSETNLGENSETKEIEDEKSSAVEINGVTISPRRKKKRAKLETVEEIEEMVAESPCSETNLGENSETKEIEDEKSSAVEINGVTISPRRKKKRAKLETVDETDKEEIESPCSETNLGENTQAKEVKGDKSNAVELSETMSSPQHKKKRAKLETVEEIEEMVTESPCSETNLGENSETKEIEDEKSSAVEINGVTISPRRKKKRAKLETVDETDEEEIETPCSETNLGENTQAKEIKGDKSNAVELSETMSSPQHKKKRAKLETVEEAEEIGTESPCSETNIKEYSEAKEIRYEKLRAVEFSEVTNSPRRKKKIVMLETVEENVEQETESACSQVNLKEYSEAREIEDEKSSAVELSGVTISPRRKKKRAKLETVEETDEQGIGSPCSEANLTKYSDAREIEDEKLINVELNGVTISSRRKKKRAKLEIVDETDEEETEPVCSETNLGENSEEREIEHDKSSAVEISGVTISPRRRKKRAKLETVEEETESHCSGTNLKEHSEARKIEDEKSSAVELSGIMISPRRMKPRAKLETVEKANCSKANLEENSEVKEFEGDKSISVELSNSMISRQRKKKRGKLETVEETVDMRTESPCSETNLGENSEAKEIEVEKSRADDISGVTISPRRQKKQDKLETVEKFVETTKNPCSDKSKNDSDAQEISKSHSVDLGCSSEGPFPISGISEHSDDFYFVFNTRKIRKKVEESSDIISVEKKFEDANVDVGLKNDSPKQKTSDEDENNFNFVTRRVTRQMKKLDVV